MDWTQPQLNGGLYTMGRDTENRDISLSFPRHKTYKFITSENTATREKGHNTEIVNHFLLTGPTPIYSLSLSLTHGVSFRPLSAEFGSQRGSDASQLPNQAFDHDASSNQISRPSVSCTLTWRQPPAVIKHFPPREGSKGNHHRRLGHASKASYDRRNIFYRRYWKNWTSNV